MRFSAITLSLLALALLLLADHITPTSSQAIYTSLNTIITRYFSGTSPIYIGFLQSVLSSPHTVVAGLIALAELNADPRLLANNVTIVPLFRDISTSLVDTRVALAAAIELLNIDNRSNRTARLIVGPTRLAAAQAVMALSSASGRSTSFISPVVSDPSLSSRSLYPNMVRLVPSDDVQAEAIRLIFLAFGWSRIATVYSAGTGGESIVSKLSANISFIATQSITPGSAGTDYRTQLRVIKRSGAYVILLAITEREVPDIFAQLKELGMYGSPYVLFGIHQTFRSPAALRSAAYADVTRGLVGTMIGGFNQTKFNMLNATWQAWKARDSTFTLNAEPDFTSMYYYDAAYAAGLAINQLVTLVAYCADPINAPTPTYATFFPSHCATLTSIGQDNMLFRIMLNTTFEGISTSVSFLSNGDVDGFFSIVNIPAAGISPVTVGYVDKVSSAVLWSSRMQGILWPDGTTSWTAPPDRPATVYQLQQVSDTTAVAFLGLAGLGLIFALLALAFNIAYRTLPLIKMSAPRINNIVMVGCMGGYILVMLLVLTDSSFIDASQYSSMCHAQLWLTTFSFTMSFGSLFSKTLRVHRIVNNPRLQKRSSVRDHHLYSIVLGLLAIDVVLNVAWSTANPFYRLLRDDSIGPTADGFGQIVVQSASCDSGNLSIWLGLVYAYKALLIAAGAVIAFKVRNVHIEALNDSKWIGMCVYNVTVLVAIVIPISSSAGSATTAAIMRAAIVWVMTTMTIALLFGPKMYVVLVNQDLSARWIGKRPQQVTKLGTSTGAGHNSSGITAPRSGLPMMTTTTMRGAANGTTAHAPSIIESMASAHKMMMGDKDSGGGGAVVSGLGSVVSGGGPKSIDGMGVGMGPMMVSTPTMTTAAIMMSAKSGSPAGVSVVTTLGSKVGRPGSRAGAGSTCTVVSGSLGSGGSIVHVTQPSSLYHTQAGGGIGSGNNHIANTANITSKRDPTATVISDGARSLIDDELDAADAMDAVTSAAAAALSSPSLDSPKSPKLGSSSNLGGYAHVEPMSVGSGNLEVDGGAGGGGGVSGATTGGSLISSTPVGWPAPLTTSGGSGASPVSSSPVMGAALPNAANATPSSLRVSSASNRVASGGNRKPMRASTSGSGSL